MDHSEEAIIDALGRTMIDSPEEPVPHLPLEILEDIVEMTDVTTCLSLALVCRALVESSRRHAFRQLSVKVHRLDTTTHTISSDDFQRLVSSPLCTFAPYCRAVNLMKSPASDPGLLLVIPQLHALTHVYVDAGQKQYSLVQLDSMLFGLRRTLTRLTLKRVRLTSLELTSALVAVPNIQKLCLFEIAEEANETVPILRPRETAAFEPETLSKLDHLQCYILSYMRDNLLEAFPPWILSMPHTPPVQRLAVRPFSVNPRSSSVVETLLRRMAPTLKDLHINSEVHHENDFLYLDYNILDFSQFALLQSVSTDPVSVYTLRTNVHAAISFGRFVHRVLAAPALRRLTFYFMVDVDERPLDEDEWEETLAVALDWCSIDAHMAASSALKEVSFVLYGRSMQRSEIDTVLAESKERIYGWMPMMNARGILRVEIDEDATNMMYSGHGNYDNASDALDSILYEDLEGVV